MNSQQQRCCRGFALRFSWFACLQMFFITFSLSQRARLLLLWSKICWLLCDDFLSSGLSAQLSYQLLASNVHAHVHQTALLALIWLCSRAFRHLLIQLLARFGLFWADKLSACVDSAWWQFYLALRPFPLTAIFLWPCGHAPLGEIDFLFAFRLAPRRNISFAPSWRYPFGLATMPPSWWNPFSIRLMVNANFYFSSTSTRRYLIRASWR